MHEIHFFDAIETYENCTVRRNPIALPWLYQSHGGLECEYDNIKSQYINRGGSREGALGTRLSPSLILIATKGRENFFESNTPDTNSLYYITGMLCYVCDFSLKL